MSVSFSTFVTNCPHTRTHSQLRIGRVGFGERKKELKKEEKERCLLFPRTLTRFFRPGFGLKRSWNTSDAFFGNGLAYWTSFQRQLRAAAQFQLRTNEVHRQNHWVHELRIFHPGQKRPRLPSPKTTLLVSTWSNFKLKQLQIRTLKVEKTDVQTFLWCFFALENLALGNSNQKYDFLNGAVVMFFAHDHFALLRDKPAKKAD